MTERERQALTTAVSAAKNAMKRVVSLENRCAQLQAENDRVKAQHRAMFAQRTSDKLDNWRSKYFRASYSRDRWRARAHDAELKLEQLTKPQVTQFGTGRYAYVSEDDRLEARRRTWRDYQRRRRAKLKAAA